MPFLGNTPAEGYKTVAKQDLTGTGATVYTLDYKVTTAAELEVFVNNVRQEPGVAYAVSGNQITFTTALESGDDCYVVFQGRAVTSNLIESQNIADGAVTAAKLDANAVPSDIIKSHAAPSSPADGDLWYDTTSKVLKVYNSDESDWEVVGAQIAPFAATGGTVTTSGNYTIHTFTSSGNFVVTGGETKAIEYLVIGGGGGGGGWSGGGAGGYRSSVSGESSGGGASAETPLSLGAGSYSITIGAGGGGYTNGGNTTFHTITSIGGGKGGNGDENGYSGGSGGGASNSWSAGTNSGGSGTSGQGYSGGASTAFSGTDGGGGGGGAGGPGSARTTKTGTEMAGGNGVASSITGTSIYRAGGGAGSTRPDQGGGGLATQGLGYDQAGGGGYYTNTTGQDGIVIIRYLT